MRWAERCRKAWWFHRGYFRSCDRWFAVAIGLYLASGLLYWAADYGPHWIRHVVLCVASAGLGANVYSMIKLHETAGEFRAAMERGEWREMEAEWESLFIPETHEEG